MDSSYDTTMYNDAYTQSQAANDQAASALAGASIAFVLIFSLTIIVISYVIHALLLGRIFKKAGVEQWKAWVPIYNTWIMLELGDQKGFWAVLMLVPVVNLVSLVFMFIAMYHIGLKLGKDGAFVLLAIFLPLIWMIWLALDKSTWQGAKPAMAGTAAAAQSAPTASTPPAVDDAPTDEDDEAGKTKPPTAPEA